MNAQTDRTRRTCSCGAVVHWQPERPRALDRVRCERCGTEHLFTWYVKLDIGLSELCNLSCNMCRRPPDPLFLETEAVLRVLDDASAIGMDVVSFCGGEPFIHKDFMPIVEHAFSLDYKVQLVTNGTLVNQKKIDRLGPLDCMTVSMDGLEDNHDRIRGQKGSWQHARKALRMASQAGITTGTNTVIQRTNADDIVGLFESNYAFLDGRIDYVRYVPVEVTPLTADLMPTAEQWKGIQEALYEVARRCDERGVWFSHRDQVTDHLPLYIDKYKRHRPLGGCHIPQRFIGYSDKGFYLCWHQGKAIRAPSLLEALDSDRAQEIVDEAMASKCVGCNALTYSWDEEWNDGILAASLEGKHEPGLDEQRTTTVGTWKA